MLQSNEGLLLSTSGMVYGNQIRLVEAVGSVTHPSFVHTASWHCSSAIQCGLITPLIRSKGCLCFDHCTNVRSMYSVAGSPAELAGHVFSAHVPAGTLGTATVLGAVALLTRLMRHQTVSYLFFYKCEPNKINFRCGFR